MTESLAFRMTQHALERCSQRGIDAEVLRIVAHHGTERPARNGCTQLTLSPAVAEELIAEGTAVLLVQRAARTTLIMGADGRCVTALRHDEFATRRRSRRGFPTRPDRMRRMFQGRRR